MNAQLPNTVSSLLSFLEKDCGLALEGQHASPAFGDTIIMFRGPHLRVRLLRDRGDWFVEVSSDYKPDEWYDMDLLKEQITGHIDQDVLSFDELAAFLRENWPRIVDMLTGQNSNTVHAALERRRQERARRRFPKWCK